MLALEPGDTVYIPACVPSRLVPDGENVQIRLKPEHGVREAVAWYCECGAAVHSNASARTCAACSLVHPLAELGDIDWTQAAAAQR